MECAHVLKLQELFHSTVLKLFEIHPNTSFKFNEHNTNSANSNSIRAYIFVMSLKSLPNH